MLQILYCLPFCLVLAALIFFSLKKGKLTLGGCVAGGLIALTIFAGAGYNGIAMLGTFFILGTLATGWRKEEKHIIPLTNDHTVKRDAWQVMANGGVAGIAGILMCLLPAQAGLFRLMIAAALASAAADTLSSELGMIYGRRFYNVITWKKDEKGLDGVVSLEGTLIGVAGSAVIAVLYGFGFGWGLPVLLIIISGTAGNLADSVLGALFERRRYVTNNVVNFLNTLIAALIVWLLL